MEVHAIQVYTNAAYMLFRKQVDISTRYHVRVTSNPLEFLVVHDKAKKKERYARAEFTVRWRREESFLSVIVVTTATWEFFVATSYGYEPTLLLEYINKTYK
jgi:hypothetical protein